MLVVVALSGGVDSSVAAALLRAEGHDVVGVTMQIWPDEGPERSERHGGCCAMGAVRDARAVAERLDIPYYVFQMREEFERHVIAQFAAAYAAGRTPNPCVACNEHIKFRALLEKARRLGADALATGHYARLAPGPDGSGRLLRGADPRKDQSYVLYPLRREDLGYLRFPTGGMDKAAVRQEARRWGLAVADKPDSQEICFTDAEGYAGVVARREPGAVRPGPMVDAGGRVLGQHRGLAHYTVGQRRGLGLSGPEPWFVAEIDAGRNTLILGRADELYACGCTVVRPNWLVPDPPAPGTRLTARVRSGPSEHAAVVVSTGPEAFELEFPEPVRAVTPGQACVLYRGEEVQGGGEIQTVYRGASQRVVCSTTQDPSTN